MVIQSEKKHSFLFSLSFFREMFNPLFLLTFAVTPSIRLWQWVLHRQPGYGECYIVTPDVALNVTRVTKRACRGDKACTSGWQSVHVWVTKVTKRARVTRRAGVTKVTKHPGVTKRAATSSLVVIRLCDSLCCVVLCLPMLTLNSLLDAFLVSYHTLSLLSVSIP